MKERYFHLFLDMNNSPKQNNLKKNKVHLHYSHEHVSVFFLCMIKIHVNDIVNFTTYILYVYSLQRDCTVLIFF